MGWRHGHGEHRNRSLRAAGLARVGVALCTIVGMPNLVHAQQPDGAPLVFDSVTVIDVAQGHQIQGQRVVIVGNRIRTMGSVAAVPLPAGARVVDARGKYLIPGLWDMHTHSQRLTDLYYPLFIANGVTGIRDAGSVVPLDTLQLWRKEILAGRRVGPPRQLLSGPALDQAPCEHVKAMAKGSGPQAMMAQAHLCVSDAGAARRVVDSLKAAGASIIKTYFLQRDGYFAVAAEARRVGLPFGGHLDPKAASAQEASDSGASIIDHLDTSGGLDRLCLAGRQTSVASVAQCQPLAQTFQRNGTWWIPTLVITATVSHKMGLPLEGFGVKIGPRAQTVIERLFRFASAFWKGDPPSSTWLRDSVGHSASASPDTGDSSAFLSLIHRAGLPVLAGTDVGPLFQAYMPPGFSLQAELAVYAAEGLTPLGALQTATLNPAKMLHATDSLGTVAPGKLADLVLLDADPLADITNTTLIRAVVANGRYYDRAELDRLLAGVQARAKQTP